MTSRDTLRRPIPPTLRLAAGETVRLCALIALYAILLALFALAAIGVWVQLPCAMLDSQLLSKPAPLVHVEPVRLRGSL